MSHKILEGKKGIIFGALDDQSIAWKTAEAVKQAGGEFVLTNAPVAMRMGAINDLADKTESIVIRIPRMVWAYLKGPNISRRN